jgi:hypothetical protein
MPGGSLKLCLMENIVLIRVVKAAKDRSAQGWRTCIEWVPGHTGIADNERANQLAGEAASVKQKGRTSIADIPTLHYGKRHGSR